MAFSLRNYLIFSALTAVTTGVAWSTLQAATVVATVEANIISMISIASRNGLSFGDVSASALAGEVTLTADGSRTTTGGATVNSATAASAAAFDLEGTPNASYAISLPLSVVLSDGSSNTMVVDRFTASPGASGVLDASGGTALYVGATLNVGNNQPFGSYNGQMAVTVDYN